MSFPIVQKIQRNIWQSTLLSNIFFLKSETSFYAEQQCNWQKCEYISQIHFANSICSIFPNCNLKYHFLLYRSNILQSISEKLSFGSSTCKVSQLKYHFLSGKHDLATTVYNRRVVRPVLSKNESALNLAIFVQRLKILTLCYMHGLSVITNTTN